MISALEDFTIELLEIIGFRGSSKSVWGSLIFPIWLALEFPDEFAFIIPIASTLSQSVANMDAIRTELEENVLLRQDYGKIDLYGPIDSAPTLESAEDWQKQNILLSNGVRIMGRTVGQKVRGIRHRQFRPRAIIGDDIESLEDVDQRENRDKTERYILGEVLPAMDERKRKFVIIGNYLHNDAIMQRLKSKMQKVLEFPLVKDDAEGSVTQEIDRCTWKAKYPTQEAINAKKKEMGEVAWQREMCLKVVAEEGQVITPADIHYYDEIPEQAAVGIQAHGVDLAISTEASADFTAVISGIVYRFARNMPANLCVMPGVVNRRMDFKSTIETLEDLKNTGGTHLFFVENVNYQQVAIETLQRKQIPVTGVRPVADKLARLRVAAQFIKDGTVKFPRTGCELLLTQLYGFGVENHDDMVDALVYLILGTVAEGLDLQRVIWLT